MDIDNEKKKINKCPICKYNGNSNGALCEYHAILLKNYDWVRGYINNLEVLDRNTIYILEFAISERKSRIMGSRRRSKRVEIVNGKMQIEEYLQKKSCSVYMGKILREIKLLEYAKWKVLNRMNSNNSNNEVSIDGNRSG